MWAAIFLSVPRDLHKYDVINYTRAWVEVNMAIVLFIILY